MLGNWIWIAILCTIGLSSLTIAIGAWLPRRKAVQDWFMVIGGTLFLFGVAGVMAFYFVPGLGSSAIGGEMVGILLYTSIAGGLLLFSMGYITDRIGRTRSRGRSTSEPS